MHSILFAQTNSVAKPSTSQLAWHEMEFYLFTHFGPNTFTGKEWGHGDEPEDIFNPSQLDCNQWARIAKEAGAKGIIITAKHHDGFCLWPSEFSKHTVRESKWKDGQGDVLKELANACKKNGLKFGVYISPWDRNHPDYGTPKYNEVYINTMKEIFHRYSPIWELWWDGANGEGPSGKKQEYDFPKFERTIQVLSPSTVIFSDIGPHIRWVGNEKGIAGDPNWNYLDTKGFKRGYGAPPTDTLNHGNYNGKHWIPAECDVSIRPGWFYHQEEDNRVKSSEVLFDIFLKSVGRGANLLLNVPPDTRGLIHANDSAALMQFKKLREQSFKNNLVANSKLQFKSHRIDYTLSNVDFQKKYTTYGVETNQIKVIFDKPVTMNCIELKEGIAEGQFIRNYKIDLFDETQLIHTISGTSIGRKRILIFPELKATSFQLVIVRASGHEKISSIKAYHLDNSLVEKIKNN
ncbi:MAG: alpha-L-fucosidase [Saprospiraceae bacterium]